MAILLSVLSSIGAIVTATEVRNDLDSACRPRLGGEAFIDSTEGSEFFERRLPLFGIAYYSGIGANDCDHSEDHTEFMSSLEEAEIANGFIVPVADRSSASLLLGTGGAEGGLNEEESRAVREGLDEESLAIFDLLKKDDLRAADVKRVKAIAVVLLETLKAEKLRVDQWQEKEATRDAVRIAIHDFLYSDETGLPVDSYQEVEVEDRTEEVFQHIYRVYPELPSPYYENAAV